MFPINKQFSIDSFLDWEGHYSSFAHLYTNSAPHSLLCPVEIPWNDLMNFGKMFFQSETLLNMIKINDTQMQFEFLEAICFVH